MAEEAGEGPGEAGRGGESAKNQLRGLFLYAVAAPICGVRRRLWRKEGRCRVRPVFPCCDRRKLNSCRVSGRGLKYAVRTAGRVSASGLCRCTLPALNRTAGAPRRRPDRPPRPPAGTGIRRHSGLSGYFAASAVPHIITAIGPSLRFGLFCHHHHSRGPDPLSRTQSTRPAFPRVREASICHSRRVCCPVHTSQRSGPLRSERSALRPNNGGKRK